MKPQRYLEGFQWPDTKWRIGELTSQLQGKTVLLGLDDMDQFKGIEMKFLAFERVLDLHEEWRGKLVLVQVTSPPRSSSQEVKVRPRPDSVVALRRLPLEPPHAHACVVCAPPWVRGHCIAAQGRCSGSLFSVVWDFHALCVVQPHAGG